MQRNRNIVRDWTRPADLHAQVLRLWDRGELLAGLVSGHSGFPKRLALRVPTPTEMVERFDDVRAWIQALQAIPHCRVERRSVNHRVLGANLMPSEAWVETIQDALELIGKQGEASNFIGLVEHTQRREPGLVDWMALHPLRALSLFRDWGRLLDVVAWIKQHPRPGIYLRQMDIPGVHSKFLEAHRGVLSELLDLVLSPPAFDVAASGAVEFAKRYGFLDKPSRIRFRILDPMYALFSGSTTQDITLNAECFARLNPNVERVFITENEVNFLAFPAVEASLIIFGGGYGFAGLVQADWLSRCRLFYWGDIDTHGFAILDQLRGKFAHVRSFLMDSATLLAFESLWGVEEAQTRSDLMHLSDEELSLYYDLRDNRIRKNVRLEQEHIGFGWVQAALSRLT